MRCEDGKLRTTGQAILAGKNILLTKKPTELFEKKRVI
jgi:hypothetical protein